MTVHGGRPAGRPGPVNPTRGALAPLAHHDVVLDGGGWLGRWRRRTLTVTLPHVLERVESGEAAGNLARLTGRSDAPHRGMVFTDSDVYKTLEAVAWAVPGSDDGDGDEGGDEGGGTAAGVRGLLDRAGDLVTLLGEVQEADGYLNSWIQGTPGRERWSDPRIDHELYCAGHLFQAAVAAETAGVLPGLAPIAVRFADLLVEQLSGSSYIDGHPQVETALVELYRLTGRTAYLELARRQVEQRGHGYLDAGQKASYFQDGVPVRRATRAVGHAVRQLYLLAGVVDVAVETGDEELLAAAVRVWDDLQSRKTYLTGAHGSRHRDEAIGDDYELPPDRAYAETCAAIGAFGVAWRLLLATGAARYADAMETLLHNAVAAAVSAEGDRYFYSNPLQLRTGHDGSDEDAPSGRLPWFACACCPPNLARLLASVPDYLLTRTDGGTGGTDGIQVHHPTAARARIDVGGRPVALRIATGYPHDGAIDVTVETDGDRPWELALRVPGWCRRFTVTVDDRPEPVDAADGYVRLRRSWAGRHAVRLVLDLPVRVLAAHPRVDAVRGCAAVARGPLVYALEQADLPAGTVLEDVRLVGARQEAASRLVLTVVTDDPDAELYPAGSLPQPAGAAGTSEPFEVTVRPYHLWANRTAGAMRVWIPTSP